MKHRNLLKLAAIPCLLVMMGCASDDTLDNGLSQKGTVPVQLTTEVEGDSSNTQTRAKLDGYTPRFVNGDNVKVWGADNTSTAITTPGYDFTAGNLNTTTNRTPLTGTIDAVHAYYYGVFPAGAAAVETTENNYVNGESVCVKYRADHQIWTEAEATGNGFDNIMVGKASGTDNIMYFKNVGCLYKVTLYNYTGGTVHSVSVQVTKPYSVLSSGSSDNSIRHYWKIGDVYQYYNTSTGVATSNIDPSTSTVGVDILKKDVTIEPNGYVNLYVLLPVLNTSDSKCQLVFTAYDGTNATGNVLAERFNYKDATSTTGYITLTRNKMYSWRMDCIRPFYGSTNCVVSDMTVSGLKTIDCTPYACWNETYRSRDDAKLISGLTDIGTRYDTYYKPTSVEELWYDGYGLTPNGNPIVLSTLKFTDNTNTQIEYRLGGYNGNAVIAIKNAKGDIIWTYHIWAVTSSEQPIDHTYTDAAGVSRTIQDRNLGAGLGDQNGDATNYNAGLSGASAYQTHDAYLTWVLNHVVASNQDYAARGLMYQWGRNIPLPTCVPNGTIATANMTKGTIEPIVGVSITTAAIQTSFTSGSHTGNRKMGNPYYNAMYPTYFSNQACNGEASTTAPYKYETNWNYYDDAAAWGNPGEKFATSADGSGATTHATRGKSIYDPCPAGYRVMTSDAFTGITNYENVSNGNLYCGKIIKPSSGAHFILPTSGYGMVYDNAGEWDASGTDAELWTSAHVNATDFSGTNAGCGVKTSTYSSIGIVHGPVTTSWAMPVRCEKIQ
jgi:hypothetical protein